MSRRIHQLLQECLEAYDSGLSPDDCLARYPESRAQLEPLLRQAISMRVAFAATPRAEFRSSAKEALMFAAGRDLRDAFQAEPDPAFKNLARYRLMQAAGSGVQEALRDVPPPRLPFWVNARRRFLQASARPRPRPKAPSGGEFALRASLSLAMVLLAVALGAVLYLAETTSPSAAQQLAKLEQQIDSIEHRARTGQPVKGTELAQLSRKTSELASRVSPEAPEARRLAELIDRQKEVVSQARVEQATAPELAQAQANLDEAQEIVVATIVTPAAPSPTPAATQTARASPTPAVTPPSTPPLSDNEVLIRPDPTDTFLGLAWRTVESNKLSLVLPADWPLIGAQTNEQGLALLSGSTFRVSVPGDTPMTMTVDISTGRVDATINGRPVVLRGAGVNGAVLPPDELANLTDAQRAQLLGRFLTSIRLH
jgi:hypothetical protein